MKIINFFLILFFSQFSYSQTTIPLKEVIVFPESFAHQIIQEMKLSTKRNLNKDFLDSYIYVNAVKNLSDTVILINRTGKFQLKGLQNRNYKFENLKGRSFYDHSFFEKYDFGNILEYGSFYGRLNKLFELNSYKFLKDFDSYKYQMSLKNNYYVISFYSDSNYDGELVIDKTTKNLLSLKFNLLKHQKENLLGRKVGTPAYIIEKGSIIESVDDVIIEFKQNNEGKLNLKYLESTVVYDNYEIFKYEENKQNNLKFNENFKFSSFVRIRTKQKTDEL